MDWVNSCAQLVVEGTGSIGRQRTTWQDSASADLSVMDVNPRDAQDRASWRKAVGR